MSIKKIQLSNFTVFEEETIDFCEGINVFIGENGTGKTHIMKLIYSACQAVDPKVSFSQKIVKTFRPDDFRISRLINRKQGITTAELKLFASIENTTESISAKFHTKTAKWDAEVKNETSWESTFNALQSTFIPAKEILSNSYNIISAAEKNNVEFDDTYLDIIHSAKVDLSASGDGQSKKSQLQRLEKILEGKVLFDAKKDRFYLKQGQARLEFNLLAEGIRKIALFWQLMKNGTLEKGAVLFWDEPEANMNPLYIPLIVDLLLALQENGVQVFISTHDYLLAKYFDIKATQRHSMKFHSLYKTATGIQCESNERFKDLENNAIRDTFIQLYEDEVERAMTE